MSILKTLQTFHPILFLLIATTLEATGDAIIRKALFNYAGLARYALFFAGAALLLGYAIALNLAPLEFGQVVGLYIAILFVVWQVVNYLSFHAIPSLSTIVGGAFIIAGGSIVTFWKT